MARLEADLALTDAASADLPQALEQIAAEIKAELCWLDLRNVSLALLAGCGLKFWLRSTQLAPVASCLEAQKGWVMALL
jgi:hypothetical protein